MNALSLPLRARNAIPRALTRALQWRLLLLWVGASLLCALVASLPVWNWLADAFNHSIDAPAIANGTAPLPRKPWQAATATTARSTSWRSAASS